MFGDQAPRLLRAKWPNPTMLAEELYSMFQDDIPLSTNAPFTINQQPGSPGLIIRPGAAGVDGVPGSTGNAGKDGQTGLPGIDGVSPPALPAILIDQGPNPTTIQLGNVTFTTNPTTIIQPPNLEPIHDLTWDNPQQLPNVINNTTTILQIKGADVMQVPPLDMQGNGITNSGPITDTKGNPITGGSSAFPGQVVSGSGSTYSVKIFTAGTGAGAGSSTVSCQQLQIKSGESVPSGTWTLVAKIGSSYYMQVPVWL